MSRCQHHLAAGTTRSGRSYTTRYDRDELGALANALTDSNYQIGLSNAEVNYYNAMESIGEFGLVGAGIGGGFNNTAELKPMKYDEAMACEDSEEWKRAVEKEYQRFVANKVMKAVKRKGCAKWSQNSDFNLGNEKKSQWRPKSAYQCSRLRTS